MRKERIINFVDYSSVNENGLSPYDCASSTLCSRSEDKRKYFICLVFKKDKYFLMLFSQKRTFLERAEVIRGFCKKGIPI